MLSANAAREIASRSWPGNVRELKTALRYALVMSESAPALEPEHLPPTNPFTPLARPAPTSTSTPSSASTGRRAAEAEGEALRAALAETRGNLTAAARVLGVARSTLYRMMLRHGLGADEP